MIRNFFVIIAILAYGLPCTTYAITGSYPCPLFSESDEEELRAIDENELQNRLIRIVDLAIQYEKGLGVEQDINRARDLYQYAADRGSATAMFHLAHIYQIGSGIAVNHHYARELLEHALSIGNIRIDTTSFCSALMYLGNLYYKGQYIAENIEKAVDYYKQAANLNYIPAAIQLGSLYFYGYKASLDTTLARLYFEKAARSGSVYALFHQGYIAYIEGNYILAHDLIQQTVDHVTNITEEILSEALTFLGKSCLGYYQYQRDYIQAKIYLERAVQFGNSGALVELGIIYNQGYGTTVDYAQAKDYFKQAAAAGEIDALTHLRYMYQMQQGRVTLKEIRLAQQAYDRTQSALQLEDHSSEEPSSKRIRNTE